MKYRYWTVQVRPTPPSATVFGVGVIVSDDHGRTACQFLEPTHPFWAYIPHATREWITTYNHTIQTQGRRAHAIEHLVPSRMETEWNNHITCVRGYDMSAPSLESATQFLFDTLIDCTPSAPIDLQ